MISLLLTWLALASTIVAAAYVWRQRCDNEILKIRIDRAEKSLALRVRLADELAHEIKNPLAAIISSSEALDLLVGDSLPDGHRKCLGYIRDYADDLLCMVTDFLELSKAESGNSKFQPQPVETAKLVSSVLGLLNSTARRKEVGLQAVIDPCARGMLIDPILFKQVLFNLVHNAVKFSPACSEVKVEVRGPCELPGKPGMQLIVSVSDCGPGLADCDLEKLRSSMPSMGSQGERGYGLGLSVVQAVLALWGAELCIRPNSGSGSIFSFTVPYHEIPDSSIQPAERDSNEALGLCLRGRVFACLNSTDLTQQACARLLAELGGAVRYVNDAAELIKLMAEAHFDAVVVPSNSKSEFEAALSNGILGSKLPPVFEPPGGEALGREAFLRNLFALH